MRRNYCYYFLHTQASVHDDKYYVGSGLYMSFVHSCIRIDVCSCSEWTLIINLPGPLCVVRPDVRERLSDGFPKLKHPRTMRVRTVTRLVGTVTFWPFDGETLTTLPVRQKPPHRYSTRRFNFVPILFYNIYVKIYCNL